MARVKECSGRLIRGTTRPSSRLLVLVEVVAAIRRRTGSTNLALRVHRDLAAMPTLRFVELDSRRSGAAAGVVEETGLRGMDAIVVQVAQEFGAVLVTLDAEMLRRAQSLVLARPVTDF